MRNVSIACLGLACLLTTGCEDAHQLVDPQPRETIDHRYTGPGSYWTADMKGDGTFEITVADTYGADVHTWVNGTYMRLPDGLTRLTVSSSSGRDAAAPGQSAYAVELPGFAMVLEPPGGGHMIPMMVWGECPDATFDANWLIAQAEEGKHADRADSEWFGVFSYQAGAKTASLPSRWALAGDFNEQLDPHEGMDGLSCDNGILRVEREGTHLANMWLTAAGGAMVEVLQAGTTDRMQTILAAPRQPVRAISDLTGAYGAMSFSGGMGATSSALGRVSLATDGTGTFKAYTDVAQGTLESDGLPISLSDPDGLGEGWITGTIGEDAPLACTTFTHQARRAVFCVGQDPRHPERPFNLVFASP